MNGTKIDGSGRRVRGNMILPLLAFMSLCMLVGRYLHDDRLDFSNDEEPFRSIAMPPKDVWASYYMDGGSVELRVHDHVDKITHVTFPIERDRINNPYPKAFFGEIDSDSRIPLKNPDRAREIAILLLKKYGSTMTDPESGEKAIATPLRELSSPLHVRAGRVIYRIQDLFD